MARRATLTADINAPTSLSAEQQRSSRNHLRVKLRKKCTALTKLLHNAGFRPITDAKDDSKGAKLYKRKEEAGKCLHRERIKLRAEILHKARERHIHDFDTRALENRRACRPQPLL